MPASEEGCCGPGEACSNLDCTGQPEKLKAFHRESIFDELSVGLEGDPKPSRTDQQKLFLEALLRPSYIIHPPEPEKKMDNGTKAALWLIGCILVACSGVLGLAVWAFIEIIQWITSK